MIFFRKEVQMNLYYIYHSGFVVEGKSHILIFDYYRVPKDKTSEKEYFLNRYVRQKEKKVYVFSSHSHGDHFNPEVLSWKQENSEIKCIFSKDIRAVLSGREEIIWVEEGEKKQIEELEIFVYGSTDAGVSFLVYMEEKIIFHAGDFHLWHWEDDTPEEEMSMRKEYFRILQNIKREKHPMIDYAFLPVDPRLGKYTTEGLETFVKEMESLYVIPIHFWENYFVMEEAKTVLDEYGVQLISMQQAMEMIHGTFYMLKKEERGYYIDLVDSYGKRLPEEEIELDPIYSYLPMEQENAFFSGWDKSYDRIFLEEQEELLDFLKTQENFVKEDFQKITWKEGKYPLVLWIREKEEEEIYSTQLELAEIDEDITIITEDIVANGSFYHLQNQRTGFYELKDFITELRFSEIEKLLTLAHKHFPDMEFRYRDYKMLNTEMLSLKPQILIEKIAADNSLYLRIGAEISSMDYKFLKENGFEEVVTLNTREKKIQISKIDASPVEELVEDLVKILTKTQRELGIRQAYYLDEDDFLILPEYVAREFITKNLLQFANQYHIAGTDKLKKYNIKAVKPRLTGNFHYSIDFLEGEAELDIEGEKFSIQEVLASYQKDSYIVLSDGTNALINKKYIEKLERIFKEKEGNKVKISFFDLPIIDDIIEEKILSEDYVLQKNFFYGMNYLKEYEVELPKLNATLRTYQEYGYKWLSYLSEKHLGACLADDMGLGKTLQAIAILTKLHQEKKKKSFIIMPKSLIYNWQSEIKRFSPTLKVGIYYGNNRDIKVIQEEDVILSTYGTVRNDIVSLKELFFDLIILDESQNIKNIHSQTTRAVMLLQSQNRISLSGTPIENNLSELYSLFRFLNPGMFGSLEEFNNTYALPIQKENNVEAVKDLRKKIYPFILRRVKKEVLKDLPDKIEKTIYIDMNPEHKKFYEERRNYYYNMIHASIREKGLGKAQFFILQALNELRQITSCPEVKNSYISSSKKEMLIEQIVEAVENDHKVLVFTNYIGSIDNICKSLEEQEIPYLSMTGSTKDRQQLVNKFQKNEKYKVFVMTLKTGGVGLNLTAADTIFIYDPWWNKTVENQAIDRAYRLGQDRTVFSYKLILKDTIEEKILQLQELKSKLLDDVISEDNLSNKSFTEKEIEFILGK